MPNVMIRAVWSFLLPRLRSSDGHVPPAEELHSEPWGRLLLCLCGRSWNWPCVSNGTVMKASTGSPGFSSHSNADSCGWPIEVFNRGKTVSCVNMFYWGDSWIHQLMHSTCIIPLCSLLVYLLMHTHCHRGTVEYGVLYIDGWTDMPCKQCPKCGLWFVNVLLIQRLTKIFGMSATVTVRTEGSNLFVQ